MDNFRGIIFIVVCVMGIFWSIIQVVFFVNGIFWNCVICDFVNKDRFGVRFERRIES